MATLQDGLMTDSMEDSIEIIEPGMTSSMTEKDKFETPEKSHDSEFDGQCKLVTDKQKLEMELVAKRNADEKRDESKRSEFDNNCNVENTNKVANEHADVATCSNNTEEQHREETNNVERDDDKSTQTNNDERDSDKNKKTNSDERDSDINKETNSDERDSDINKETNSDERDSDINKETNSDERDSDINKDTRNDESNSGVVQLNHTEELEAERNRDLTEFVWLNIRWPLKAFLAALIIPCIGIFISLLIDSLKPEIKFDQENIHVAPSKGEWQIKARCRAFAAGQIKKCIWKQLPIPRNVDDTVLSGGTKNCLGISSNEIDASLKNLKIPNKQGKYKFELTCADNYDRKNTQRFFVMVGEKPNPIVIDIKHHVSVSIESGSLQLHADCRAIRGRIVARWWRYVSGPKDLDAITTSKHGYITFRKPGVYKFEYKCKDNYGMQSEPTGSIVRVAVQPPFVLGIDLGTSTTCVSYIDEDGSIKDIKLNGDDDKEPCMPSVVAFAENGELLIGKRALNQAVVNPLSTIYEVKRLIGQSFYDVDGHKFVYGVRPTLKSHSSRGTRAAIEIPCKGYENKLLQPEVISALILHRVAEIAQAKLGVAIKDVMISVPAQFDDAQRKATMDAGRIAGLNPQKIVNEPTVAAFAAASFVDDMRGTEDEVEVAKPNITTPSVVVDIGGGTSDFSYMEISGSYYRVVTTGGNKTLGGRDIDILLAENMTKIFQNRYSDIGVDLNSPEFQQNLRIECEKAKRELSDRDSYTLRVKVNVTNHGMILLDQSLSRSDFEDYIENILKAMIKPLDSLLSRGSKTKEDIKDLYLVGGTVRIPKLQQLLEKYFPNVTANSTYRKDPVQGVSRGAAKYGAVVGGILNATWQPHVDTIALPIQVVDNENLHEVFERSRLYPCTEKVNLTTYTNNQTAIVIQVYEGECRATTDKCQFLGEFKLSGIPPQPKGVPKINAIFTVDSNGILNVTASYEGEKTSLKHEMSLDVYSRTGSMSDMKIEELSSLVRQLVSPASTDRPKCSLLENIPPMTDIPPEPNKSNVLKLAVDSEYDGVRMIDDFNPDSKLSVVAMVTIKGILPTSYVLKTAKLDIVLIVDKSRSMEGNRLQTVKNLIMYLVNSVLKENHRIGVVSFDDTATRLIELMPATKENKEFASNIVNAIETSGGTNTYEGLLAGLRMAYEEGRRACVMLFTDGNPDTGLIDPDDIVRKTIDEKIFLKERSPTSQVDLHTFGIFGYEDRKDFLLNLAESVGDGSYHNVDNSTDLANAFAYVVSNAINQIAEGIQITISPSSDRVHIGAAMTKFRRTEEVGSLIIKIPTLADQESRHIPLKLTVSPTKEKANYEELFRVEMTYNNLITESVEKCDEYLYVARTHELNEENLDVIEQLNRVQVAKKLHSALKYVKEDNRDGALEDLKEAEDVIEESVTKDSSLSVCIRNELAKLILMVKNNLNTAKMPLEESSKSHWHEKGGSRSCYLTRREDTMITVVKGNTTMV